MTEPAQIPLDLPHRSAMGAADFLVAPCNRDAVAWLDRWPDWPATVLIVHGPSACGKTHLARLWLGMSGAVAVPRGALNSDSVPRLLGDAGAVLVEDADRGVDAEALLHLYNLLAERRGHLLLTGRQPAPRWPIALPDLASRLAAGLSAAIGGPDDSLIAAVLVKHFSDRQIRVDPSVPAFLLPRIERSFDAARNVAAALDAAAMAQKRKITVPLAREVLQRLENEPTGGDREPWILD